jgi:hypothetical protein
MKNALKTVFIPKQGRNDSERYIAINGKRLLVRTGESVEIPAEFAAVIENSLKMAAHSDDYIAENRRDD